MIYKFQYNVKNKFLSKKLKKDESSTMNAECWFNFLE